MAGCLPRVQKHIRGYPLYYSFVVRLSIHSWQEANRFGSALYEFDFDLHLKFQNRNRRKRDPGYGLDTFSLSHR